MCMFAQVCVLLLFTATVSKVRAAARAKAVANSNKKMRRKSRKRNAAKSSQSRSSVASKALARWNAQSVTPMTPKSSHSVVGAHKLKRGRKSQKRTSPGSSPNQASVASKALMNRSTQNMTTIQIRPKTPQEPSPAPSQIDLATAARELGVSNIVLTPLNLGVRLLVGAKKLDAYPSPVFSVFYPEENKALIRQEVEQNIEAIKAAHKLERDDMKKRLVRRRAHTHACTYAHTHARTRTHTRGLPAFHTNAHNCGCDCFGACGTHTPTANTLPTPTPHIHTPHTPMCRTRCVANSDCAWPSGWS